jgi:hypothetical protein
MPTAIASDTEQVVVIKEACGSSGFPIRDMEYFADLQLVRLATDQQRHWLTCFQGRFDALRRLVYPDLERPAAPLKAEA